MKPTIIAVIALIGIGCLCFGAFGSPYFKNSVIEDSKQKVLSDVSAKDNLTNSYSKPFHLNFNQILQVKIVVNVNTTPLQDDSLRLIFLSSWTFANQSINATYTEAGAGLGLVSYNLQYPQAPTTATGGASVTIAPANQGLTYRVDFMGTRSGNNLISVPGDYYIVIWANDTGNPDGGNLTFDIVIEMNGLSDTMGLIFNLAGLGCLVLAGVLVVLYIRKEGR